MTIWSSRPTMPGGPGADQGQGAGKRPDVGPGGGGGAGPLTRSEVVQVIGTKFVLYRQSHRKDKKDKIVLVEGKKRESVPQREP
mgnify:CR=1 FL=1